MDQAVMVFNGTAARGSAITSPEEGMVTYNSSTDLLEVYNGSKYKAFASMSTATTTGSVLQVVTTTHSSIVGNSTNVYADTGLSLSITPTATSSRILVWVSGTASKQTGNSNNSLLMRLVRGSTAIYTVSEALGYNALDQNLIFSYSIAYVDSPSTTSSTTYKTQFANLNNGASVQINNNSGVTSMILMELSG